MTAAKAERAPIIDSEGNGGLEAARKDGTMELKDVFRRAMLSAGCDDCMAMARAAGVEPGDCGSTEGECRACAERAARALAGRMMPEGGRPMNHDEETARIVGWLQGFASTVWLLPQARKGGTPLVADEVCAEYERNVDRLAELAGLGEE